MLGEKIYILLHTEPQKKCEKLSGRKFITMNRDGVKHDAGVTGHICNGEV